MPDSLMAVGTWRAMWRLALPVLVEESLTMLVGWTDWWLAGHYLADGGSQGRDGFADLPVVAAGESVCRRWRSALRHLSRGPSELGDSRTASRVTDQALLCGMTLAVVMTIVLWLGGPQIISWMQLRGQPAEAGVAIPADRDSGNSVHHAGTSRYGLPAWGRGHR